MFTWMWLLAVAAVSLLSWQLPSQRIFPIQSQFTYLCSVDFVDNADIVDIVDIVGNIYIYRGQAAARVFGNPKEETTLLHS